VTDMEMWLLAWNCFVMMLYGTDKLCAQKGARRIRESVLLSSAFLLGGAGAMLGMVLFHHKTSKMKFRILVPLAFILSIYFAGNFYNLVL